MVTHSYDLLQTQDVDYKDIAELYRIAVKHKAQVDSGLNMEPETIIVGHTIYLKAVITKFGFEWEYGAGYTEAWIEIQFDPKDGIKSRKHEYLDGYLRGLKEGLNSDYGYVSNIANHMYSDFNFEKAMVERYPVLEGSVSDHYDNRAWYEVMKLVVGGEL
jgi:hypothetical protein